MGRELRLGLIGAGHWGKAYIKTLAALAGVRLARVASSNPETAKLVPKGCALTHDWHRLPEAGDLDGVIVCTPPALHAAMTAECLVAGKPVLVEKPLTMDPAAAADLLALARKHAAFVLVDHVYLFHPAFVELKNRARALGVPQLISSSGGRRGPFRADAPPLWDFGPHDVAMALDFMGEEPKAVSAGFRPQAEGEFVDLRLDFPDGVQARLCVGNAFQKRERTFCVRFRDAALTFDDEGERTLVFCALDSYGKPKGRGETIKVEKAPPLSRAVQAFAEGIRAGAKDLSSLELGVKVVDILARCAESRLK